MVTHTWSWGRSLWVNSLGRALGVAGAPISPVALGHRQWGQGLRGHTQGHWVRRVLRALWSCPGLSLAQSQRPHSLPDTAQWLL